MSYPTYRIHTAPIRDEESQAYRVRQFGEHYPGVFNAGFAQSLGMDVGGKVFDFEPDTPNYIENPLIKGRSRIGIYNLPRRNLILKPQELDAADWITLNAILSTGRPIAVGAWFDESTVWMSHFAGVDDVFGGVAEVGKCNAGQIRRRNAGDYWQHPVAGWNNLVSGLVDDKGNKIPKIVPGDVGYAIALEDSTYNIKTAYSPGSGAPIFANASASGTSQRTVASFYGPGLPTGWADHIQMRWITSTSVYRETADITFPNTTGQADSQHFTAVLLARGSGNFRMSSTSGGEYNDFTLSDDVQAFPIYFGVSAAGTSRIRVAVETTAGANVHMIVHGLAVYPGRFRPSSFPTNTGTWDSPQVPDSIVIEDVMPSDQYTLAVWFQYQRSDSRKVLFSNTNLGQTYHVYFRNETLSFEQDTGSTYNITDVFSAFDDGEWVQLVITFGPNPLIDWAHRYTYYLQGVNVGTQNSNQNLFPLIQTSGSYEMTIGSSISQPWWSCSSPISRWRLDSRVWSAAEVLQDKVNWTDPGMKAFLGKVTGRYFLPEHSMGPVGPFIDRMRGDIRLRQVDIRPQSAT